MLTPWRVVNMHLGDCLGGYSFYDEQYVKMLDVPRYIDGGKVTEDVYATDSKVLEINSKSGLYPLFVAYNIYRRRVEEAKRKYGEVDRGFALSLWDSTIEQNIFVICKTPMARDITRRTLVGFRNTRVNAQYYKDLIEVIKNNPATFVNEVRDGRRFWNTNNNDHMKFNAIVGNPPYQVMDGGHGSSSKSIYNEFVTISQKIAPLYISMIMPSRWMTGGKGLDAFRDMMINDKRIQIMHDFMEASALFSNVQIEGGICYFLWNSRYSKPCMYYSHSAFEVNMVERYLNSNDSDVVIRDAGILNILDKVLALKEESFADFVLPRNPFGVYDYESYLVDHKETNSLKLFGRFENVRTTLFLSNDYVVNKNKDIAKHWKVFVSKADGAAGQIGNPIPAKIIGKAVIGDKETICTETFLAIGPFSSKQECINIVKYAETKFFRIMVGIRKNKNMTRDTYKFVPLQDFTSQSDIDWSVSIPEIDEQLYQKYGLSDDEIAFIEKMIKPM